MYKARKEVLDDLQLIVTNCYAYNTARGINLHMEQDARMLLEKGKARYISPISPLYLPYISLISRRRRRRCPRPLTRACPRHRPRRCTT